MDSREYIAWRVAQELHDGDIVNLGIGLPTLVVKYIPDHITVILQSENGILHMGPPPPPGEEDYSVVNAGGKPVTVLPGGCFFDSAWSFCIIRGGHIDQTVLGALEVDEKGNLANWMIPGRTVAGMGGAMDLVTGARRVIIAMEHCTREGNPKILRQCSLPLTAVGQVKLIVTEKAVIEVGDKGLVLRELAPGVSVQEVIDCTEARLIIPDNLLAQEQVASTRLLNGG